MIAEQGLFFRRPRAALTLGAADQGGRGEGLLRAVEWKEQWPKPLNTGSALSLPRFKKSETSQLW